MQVSEMEDILAEGEEKHLLLLGEATDLLKRMGYISTEELSALLERRRSMILWIQEFNERLVETDASGPGVRAALERFRILQEGIVKKILEVDALVVGLAQDRRSDIEAQLQSLTKGKQIRRKFMDSGSKPEQHNLEGVF